MVTDTFKALPGFLEYEDRRGFDLSSDQLKVALSNIAPGSESSPPNGATVNCALANVTQIDYTHLSSRDLTTLGSSQSGGTYQLTLDDLVLTASGGNVGPFRYIYIFDEDSAGDLLIGYLDYGSNITIVDGQTFTLTFDAVDGLLQKTKTP